MHSPSMCFSRCTLQCLPPHLFASKLSTKFVKGYLAKVSRSNSQPLHRPCQVKAHWIQTTRLKPFNLLLPSPTFSFYQKSVCKKCKAHNQKRRFVHSESIWRWHSTLQLISTHFNSQNVPSWWHDCARLLHVQPMQLPPRSLWDIWNLQEDLAPGASWSGPRLNCRIDMAVKDVTVRSLGSIPIGHHICPGTVKRNE